MKKIAADKNYRMFKKAFNAEDFDHDDLIRIDEAYRYIDRLIGDHPWFKSLTPAQQLYLSSIHGILVDYRLK
jgi:hypothetical protein